MLNVDRAEILMDMGYGVTSRKHGIIARIDSDEWFEHLSNTINIPDLSEGMGVKDLSWFIQTSLEDWYRRVLSKDTLCVKRSLCVMIENSSNLTPTGHKAIGEFGRKYLNEFIESGEVTRK